MGISKSLELSAKSSDDGQQLLCPLPEEYKSMEEESSILKHP
jgi:hypothetical protein